jgi:hypothetical protein
MDKMFLLKTWQRRAQARLESFATDFLNGGSIAEHRVQAKVVSQTM